MRYVFLFFVCSLSSNVYAGDVIKNPVEKKLNNKTTVHFSCETYVNQKTNDKVNQKNIIKEDQYICTKVSQLEAKAMPVDKVVESLEQQTKNKINNALKKNPSSITTKKEIQEKDTKEKDTKDIKVNNTAEKQVEKKITYPYAEEIVIFKYKEGNGELRYYMQAPKSNKTPIIEVKTIYKITESPGNFTHTFKKPRFFTE